ncbi:MAG: hypothetical protein ACPGTO_07265 [Polaribacter sp.]
MKQSIIFSLLYLISINSLQSQISEAQFKKLQISVGKLEKDRDYLKIQYLEIEQKRSKIESKLFLISKSSFDKMESSIREALDKTDVISSSANYQKVLKTTIKLHNEITKVNNFTDAEKVFGFDFVDEIMKVTENTLINQITKISENEKESTLKNRKNRFRNIIRNIVKNPIVSGFLKSNPITSVAHSIINQTVSAQTIKIDKVAITRGNYNMPENFKKFKKSYSSFKDSYVTSKIVGLPESQSIILNGSIKIFTSKLKPLIDIFDNLSKINDEFESSLKVFMEASKQTITRAQSIEAKFYKKLGVKTRLEARNKINQFFNVGPNPPLELLENTLNNPITKNTLSYSHEVNEVYLLLKNDFLKIISLEIELANKYLSFFKKLKKGGLGLPLFNNEKITDKIKTFQTLKLTLENIKHHLEGKKKHL